MAIRRARLSLKTYGTFALVGFIAGFLLATFIRFFGMHMGFILESTYSYIALTAVLVSGAFVSLIFFSKWERKLEQEEAIRAQQVLDIANKTLPYLRTGLSIESATQVAKIIFERTDAIAVALTDLSTVLAFSGVGSDHHKPGESILTRATKEALQYNEVRILRSQREIGCPYKDCPLKIAIVAPLEFKKKAAGALKFYYSSRDRLTEGRVMIAEGLARLLSTQLELSDLERKEELAARAELKALQAQINPHFLFNTLNTIGMFCRTSPSKARELLVQFADFFRRSLERSSDFVTLDEELDYVSSYLLLERARFGEKLKVEEKIDKKSLRSMLPAFTLQPLVENSVKHGISSDGSLNIKIEAKIENSALVINVEDDGIGITRSDMKKILMPGFGKGLGIGLHNVNERLTCLYGEKYGLDIASTVGRGTKVTVRIPVTEGLNEAKSAHCG
jgi:LytS/YehU family sensor histidine kinase